MNQYNNNCVAYMEHGDEVFAHTTFICLSLDDIEWHVSSSKYQLNPAEKASCLIDVTNIMLLITKSILISSAK